MNTPYTSRALIPALGTAQIISWGSLYYTIAVLARDIRRELDLPASLLFSTYTCALLASAMLAPTAGRLVDRFGGRVVLSAGSIIAASALTVLAFSNGMPMLLAGYALSGVAMACTLYEPAFATLHRLRPATYRRAVTFLTLFGGFASTVFWPLGSWLNAGIGWRSTLILYAALHLLVALPLHHFVVPREAARALPDPRAAGSRSRPVVTSTFYWLAAAFALASMIFGSLSAHLIELLTGRGLTLTEAVAIGACIGPMQVTGRLFEFVIARHTKAIHVGVIAFSMMGVGMALLASAGTSLAVGVAFAIIYGMGNGMFTIARGIAPGEILGTSDLGALLGRLARFHLPAVALAPAGFALLRDSGLPQGALIGGLGALACCAAACFLIAATRPRGHA